MPVVKDGELVYTFEGNLIYFNIVQQIIKMENQIDFDNANFLKLIMDNIQIFERHWRKMVADIRNAKLDRNLEIPIDVRNLFESTNLPRPQLAKRLDATFRQLGFHKKVLGKDINIQPFAFPKNLEKKSKNKRKISLPIISIKFDGRNSAEVGERKALSPLKAYSQTKTTEGIADIPSGSDTRSKSIGKSKREILAALTSSMGSANIEEETDYDLTSPDKKTGTRKRRGSETDILIPTSITQVNRLHYEQETAARKEYTLAVQTESGRFVCPFPACGQTFNSKNAVFSHLTVHEQRTRLYAPTPLADSFLNSYWPADVPWLTAEKFTTRVIPPGSLTCTVSGCEVVFSNLSNLEAHLRLTHKKIDESSLSLGYFKLDGNYISVPPYNPPPHCIPLKWCTMHVHLSSKCPSCSEIEKIANIPKQPFKIYDSITIDFKAKRALKNLPVRKSDSIIRLISNDWATGVVVELDSGSDMRGRVVASLIDRNTNCWLAVKFLISAIEADARYVLL